MTRGPDDAPEIRLPTRQAVMRIVIESWPVLIVLVLSLQSDLGVWNAALLAFASATLAVQLWLHWRHGTRLTPTHLVVTPRLLSRTRRIPWSDITHIWVGRDTTSTAVVVRVLDRSGKDVALPAPVRRVLRVVDERFDEKVELILRWGEQHRGADWVPSAPELPPPVRPGGSPDPYAAPTS